MALFTTALFFASQSLARIRRTVDMLATPATLAGVLALLSYEDELAHHFGAIDHDDLHMLCRSVLKALTTLQS